MTTNALQAASTPIADDAAARTGLPRKPRLGFGRVLLTIPHLAALGILGTVVFVLAVTLLSAGLGLVLLAGVGLVLLVGLVYLLFGVGWFEVERVRGLYGLERDSLTFRPRQRPGFGGWLGSLGRQCIDGSMWLALLSFTIGSVLGLLVVQLATMLIWNLAFMIGGEQAAFMAGPWRLLGVVMNGGSDPALAQTFSSPGWSLVAAALALAAILALAALHAVIARALLGSPTRRQLAGEVRTRTEQREGAVRAAEFERTRIERDLHDGVQPRLVSIGMTLGLAQQKIDEDPQAAKALAGEAHTSTKAAITELRQLARGIHASVLDDRGLDAALSALAARSHVPVVLDVRMDGRPVAGAAGFRDAEAAAYFSIAEALTNAAKHSRATECRVIVRLRDPGTEAATLWARVEDNGIGGAEVQAGGGLDGISNRVLAAGGTIRIDSPQGGPTALEVSVPCAY